MSIVAEFKEFAMKGNVVDMAVGVVIGMAFGKIIAALVGSIIMPIVGALTGGVNFAELAANVGTEAAPVLLTYGEFVQAAVDFLIIAAVIFLALKGINKMKKPPAPAAAPPPPKEEVLLTEIRDLLKQR